MPASVARDFSTLFKPGAVAIVGASIDPTTISGQPLAYLTKHGYTGTLYPVNPKYPRIADLPCYPDITSLPTTPDLAVIAIGAKMVPSILTQCGEKGIPFVIILTSGFAEIGDEGIAAQEEIKAIAERYGIGVIGPNCQGMMNIADRIHVGFGAPYGMTHGKGAISVTSQSGAWGNAILILANQEGLGFRRYVSTGNEACTTSLDLIESYIDDPETRAITAYVEGFKDAHRTIAIGHKALAAGKPIFMWKVGTSEAGAIAAASHTANLGGAPALYRAAFHQAGIIEVSDVGDLADCARALLAGRLPRGNRVGIVTTSGGAGILMADNAAHAGLEIAKLTAETIAGLRKILPRHAGFNNPIDVAGGAGNELETYRQALLLVARDPNVDMLGIPLAAVSGPNAYGLVTQVVAVALAVDIPVLVAWQGDDAANTEGYALLESAGVPRYKTPVRCARGFDALWQYVQAQRRLAVARTDKPLLLERPASKAQLAKRTGDLAEYEAKRVLADYGIPVTVEKLAGSRTQAEQLAAEIGFPVALKVQSPAIAHKTEAGGVRIGLANVGAVGQAYDEIIVNAKAHAPEARIDGVLVQSMVAGGVEVILGVKNDPLFGPAIMFGLGGIFAEVMKDVTFRVAPVSRSEAAEMIREIRAFPVLDGARGKPKADIAALIDAIVHLSALAIDLKNEVAEIDINPLFVLPVGKGVVAGDALIRPHVRTAAQQK
ncbi:MAG: acetate--CoA ligase family protein [Burkholderiales bacterium]